MKPVRFFRPAHWRTVLLSALAFGVSLSPVARAGDDKAAPVPLETNSAAAAFKLSGEFDFVQTFVGSSDLHRLGRDGSVDEYDTDARFVFTPRVPLGFLRLGAEWNRYSFGFSQNRTPLPNTLQSVSLVLGLDTKFSDSILVRIEAQPGLYGTYFSHIDSGQFDVPFLVGGTYIYNPDLQFIGGLSVDIHRKYPLLPAVGLRWKFAPHLVLDGVLPAPRLEYELSRATTIYVGAEFKEDSFRVDPRNQNSLLNRRLNHAIVTFSETLVGAGVTRKIFPSLSLSAEAGCQPYREFDYDRADVRYHGRNPVPYGQLLLHGAF